MLGLRYLKVPPTTYVLQYVSGKVHREGAGMSFFYFAPNSVIALVPAGSSDLPFFFEEVTSDFQEVSIQGQLTYQIKDPAALASILDFSVDARQRHVSDDPSKIGERLTAALQGNARSFAQNLKLGGLLSASNELAQHLLEGLRSADVVQMLGLEILGLSITGIRPTPEMAKAMQADARETLLKKADEAVFERRNAGVEMERKIRENELETDIAVEEKRKQVRERKMLADIAVEQKRTELVENRVANQLKEAKARGEAIEATLAPVKDVDWRTLLAASGNLDAKQLIAMAFQDLASGDGKVGNLNITPDLLNALMESEEGK